ncbi:DUF3850 domain-containing protein [Pantoea agglomerans]|uniref:DUF3850 domain-containing protein n=1 Tax=Enterobacter agglomerans TaxID=549 RepID=UPI0016548139|nr:DUF3850 domain-containing protein [Pantoea agglomerans]
MAIRQHHLKIAPSHLNAVLDGSKKAELRKNDRDFKVGDVLALLEYANDRYTGREWAAVVTHVLPAEVVMPNAGEYAVLSIKPVSPSDARSYMYFGVSYEH